MRRHLITGGAGFIGANLVRALRGRGDAVLVVDDLSRGRREHLAEFADAEVQLIVADASETDSLRRAVGDARIDEVWHLAANSDIPAGVADLRVDLRHTFLTTAATLEVMRDVGAKVLHFASTSAVYGDFGERVASEDSGPLEPISNYGAMKLASEAQIRAACESFVERANVFRFANVVGVPATHGVILDFVRKLKASPGVLEVLGDGTQKKPYLHVGELVEAMLFVADRAQGRFNVVNIGPEDDGITVREIAEIVVGAFAPEAEIRYGREPRGWVGDVPRFRYALERLRALGWRSEASSHSAIQLAVREIGQQEGWTTCRP